WGTKNAHREHAYLQGQTRRKAGTQSFRSTEPSGSTIAGLPIKRGRAGSATRPEARQSTPIGRSLREKRARHALGTWAAPIADRAAAGSSLGAWHAQRWNSSSGGNDRGA